MISIVIPCKDIEEAITCAFKCLNLDYPCFEVIILPDHYPKHDVHGAKIIATGEILPAQKRDIGIQQAKGNIIAFIDSDAYPRRDWLREARKELHCYSGVCGAGILPRESSFREQAADTVLRMLPMSYRVKISGRRLVNDYPTFNLILWKDVIEQAGGFNCLWLTGEDTLLCKKITDKGHKIIYSPDVVVFHRRRELLAPFLRQVATYATHRGYFFRKGIGDSRKWVYAIPSFTLLLALALCLLF